MPLTARGQRTAWIGLDPVEGSSIFKFGINATLKANTLTTIKLKIGMAGCLAIVGTRLGRKCHGRFRSVLGFVTICVFLTERKVNVHG